VILIDSLTFKHAIEGDGRNCLGLTTTDVEDTSLDGLFFQRIPQDDFAPHAPGELTTGNDILRLVPIQISLKNLVLC